LHLNDPNPVTLYISGSIESFSLTVPTFADITVGGNTYNFGFSGQNLSPSQTTTINVAGSITYRGDLTSETLSGAITSGEFDSIIGGDPALAGALSYDPTTGTLSFIGVMASATEQSLLNPTDANGNAILTGAQLAAWQSSVAQLYSDSQSASLGDNGLALSGPGNFNITANSMDLGISGGITVSAPDAALAAISPYGANINVTTAGNLEMTTTTIANQSLLGGIVLNVGGTLDVGGELTAFGDPSSPKGIFTTSGGNISVTANDDVNVDGSRIAAYDGGSITVESFNGDVNAGTGGAGYVALNALELDPVTGELLSIPATIPGSGILATTVSGSDTLLGNILVETPHGNISTSQGGVVQISFNGTDASQATAELLAGYELRDANGNRVLAGNLNDGTPVEVSDGENVDAGSSGVVAQNIVTKATGEAQGLFVGFNTVNLDANVIGPGIAFGPHINIDSEQAGSGIGIQGISDNPTTINGEAVAATAPVTQAPATEAAPVADTATTVAAKTDDSSDDDYLKKKGSSKEAALAEKASRVTLILPGKSDSPPASSQEQSTTRHL
jgi:hypothetical protein